MHKTIGIVGAKRHSRRLPGKNLLIFQGRPLFLWSIIQLLNSKTVDLTVLTTDDPDIAAMGREAGAYAFIRQSSRARDPDAAINEAYIEVIEHLWDEGLIGPDTAAHMALATSPLRLPADFDYVSAIMDEGADYVLPICPLLETDIYDLRWLDVAVPVVFDKSFNFGIQGGGYSTWRVGHYLEVQEHLRKYVYKDGLTDSAIDARVATGLTPDPGGFYPRIGDRRRFMLHPWQTFEVDDQDGWTICEALMSKFIFEPYGYDCYERYRTGELEAPAPWSRPDTAAS